MNSLNFKIYEVGGSVRDAIIGRSSNDLDYAVEAPSWAALHEFVTARGAKIYLETPQYFTIRAKDPLLGPVDFAICRKDGAYTDGRHPDDVTIGTIHEDLNRRDFTVNAIARDIETNEILDPHHGRRDIACEMLRFVGEPNQRLAEDKLRAFRALRFQVQLGFYLASETDKALSRLRPDDFKNITTERIRDELFKMFQENSRESANLLFRDYPYLGEVALSRGIWLKPTTEVVK